MSLPSIALSTPPAPATVRGLLIVARDQVDLYECLKYAYGDSERITVFLDRRHRERRRAMQPMVAG